MQRQRRTATARQQAADPAAVEQGMRDLNTGHVVLVGDEEIKKGEAALPLRCAGPLASPRLQPHGAQAVDGCLEVIPTGAAACLPGRRFGKRAFTHLPHEHRWSAAELGRPGCPCCSPASVAASWARGVALGPLQHHFIQLCIAQDPKQRWTAAPCLGSCVMHSLMSQLLAHPYLAGTQTDGCS